MINLLKRSYQKEILDGDNVPFVDIKKNMQELNTINSLLGGHNITLAGFKKLAANKAKIHVCEIGCGGGDNLKAIESFCLKNKIGIQFTGIDIKKECLDFAAQQYPELKCDWICSDYLLANFKQKPDIIFSSLFCHHFKEKELEKMLKWMYLNSNVGFFINDLQRNIFAYYSIKWITAVFSKSYMVKHDAPLSVSRGFHKKEWEKIIKHTGLKNISILWKWAFRYLLIYRHD